MNTLSVTACNCYLLGVIISLCYLILFHAAYYSWPVISCAAKCFIFYSFHIKNISVCWPFVLYIPNILNIQDKSIVIIYVVNYLPLVCLNTTDTNNRLHDLLFGIFHCISSGVYYRVIVMSSNSVTVSSCDMCRAYGGLHGCVCCAATQKIAARISRVSSQTMITVCSGPVNEGAAWNQ